MSARPVCSSCRTEMKCVKNERIVHYGDNWVRSGDEYECPDCGGKVVIGFGSLYTADKVDESAITLKVAEVVNK